MRSDVKKIQSKIVSRIQSLLAKKHWSAEKLAKEIGMSKSYIYAVIRYEKGIGLDTLERIAKGLDVKVKDLII